MCSDIRRAVISNFNFELCSEVTTNSTKLGSTEWKKGVGEGMIWFLLVFFIWIVLSLFHIKAFYALTWNKFFDGAYCLVK